MLATAGEITIRLVPSKYAKSPEEAAKAGAAREKETEELGFGGADDEYPDEDGAGPPSGSTNPPELPDPASATTMTGEGNWVPTDDPTADPEA